MAAGNDTRALTVLTLVRLAEIAISRVADHLRSGKRSPTSCSPRAATKRG